MLHDFCWTIHILLPYWVLKEGFAKRILTFPMSYVIFKVNVPYTMAYQEC